MCPVEAQEPEDGPWGLLEWLILPFVLMWEHKFWTLVGIAALAGAFGLLDKDKVPESRSCPGYGLVRSLKSKEQINTFAAVKPEESWDCEYSLDNENALVRFKTSHGEVLSEIESNRRASSAYLAADKEMRAEGYASR